MAAYRRVDDLTVACRLTACTPGSAPGPTLGIEYGKPLPLPFTYTEQATNCCYCYEARADTHPQTDAQREWKSDADKEPRNDRQKPAAAAEPGALLINCSQHTRPTRRMSNSVCELCICSGHSAALSSSAISNRQNTLDSSCTLSTDREFVTSAKNREF